MTQATDDLSSAVDIISDEFADAAHFTARDSAAVACAVLLEHNLSRYGNVAQVAGKTVVVGVRVREVAEMPRKGDVFDLVTGKFAGRSLRVDSVVSSDALEHKVLAA